MSDLGKTIRDVEKEQLAELDRLRAENEHKRKLLAVIELERPEALAHAEARLDELSERKVTP